LVKLEDFGFAKDFFLPILAACTAILLLIITSAYSASSGIPHPQALYVIAYGAGMISAIVL